MIKSYLARKNERSILLLRNNTVVKVKSMEKSKIKKEYQVEVLTGLRPTGNLTLANYLGAVKPVIDLQEKGHRLFLFVADFHAMTDNEPATARKFTQEIVADFIALGIDPKKTTIYLQSDITCQVTTLMTLLARHISVADLLRVPTLKDKIKGSDRPETANALLFLYPVMMAADILVQRARKVPVGEDQLAHLEISRKLARRFNKKYSDVFPIPESLQIKSLRILSLRGSAKMSKSLPEDAIFLTDDHESVERKIKRAETAVEGKMSDNLKSHILLVKSLCKKQSDRQQIDAYIKAHLQSKPVMKDFKQLSIRIIQEFLEEFQTKRAEIIKYPTYISSIFEKGAKIAKVNANQTMELVRQAIYQS
jgi:tryptophanyl-tRNA synthetase